MNNSYEMRPGSLCVALIGCAWNLKAWFLTCYTLLTSYKSILLVKPESSTVFKGPLQ